MQSLTGKLLVSMPGIGDSRFSRSVILVCSHNDKCAMGLVLNKPIRDLTLPKLLMQLKIEHDIQIPEMCILNGGPVGTNRGFVIHSGDYFSDDETIEIDGNLCMTATRDVLKALAAGGAPYLSAITLGYAGWGPGHLENELSENVWLVADPHIEIIFGEDHAIKWKQTVTSLGIDPARLHTMGGRA